MKKAITNPFENIGEQIQNICKSYNHDLLLEQVKELKAENGLLKGQLSAESMYGNLLKDNNEELENKCRVLTEALQSILNTKQEIGRSQPYIDTILEIAETAINTK